MVSISSIVHGGEKRTLRRSGDGLSGRNTGPVKDALTGLPNGADRLSVGIGEWRNWRCPGMWRRVPAGSCGRSRPGDRHLLHLQAAFAADPDAAFSLMISAAAWPAHSRSDYRGGRTPAGRRADRPSGRRSLITDADLRAQLQAEHGHRITEGGSWWCLRRWPRPSEEATSSG